MYIFLSVRANLLSALRHGEPSSIDNKNHIEIGFLILLAFNPTKIEEWWLFKFDVFDVEDELPAFGSEDFPTPEKMNNSLMQKICENVAFIRATGKRVFAYM